MKFKGQPPAKKPRFNAAFTNRKQQQTQKNKNKGKWEKKKNEQVVKSVHLADKQKAISAGEQRRRDEQNAWSLKTPTKFEEKKTKKNQVQILGKQKVMTPPARTETKTKPKFVDSSDEDDDEIDEEVDDEEEFGVSDEELELEDESEDEEEETNVEKKTKKSEVQKPEKQVMAPSAKTKTMAPPAKTETKAKPKFVDSSDEDDDEMDEEVDDEEEFGMSDEELELEDKSEDEEEETNVASKEKKTTKDENKVVPKQQNGLKGTAEKRSATKTKEPQAKKPRLEAASTTEQQQTPKNEKDAKMEKKKNEKVIKSVLSADKQNAIYAEEQRRRDERNSRSIYMRSEMLQNMKPGEIKALHPDIIAVRKNKRMCWLMFGSESATEKAYEKLAKKKELSGKELFVDRCGSKAAKATQNSPKKRPVNPLELVVSHFPVSTTKEQLKVIFPKASNIKVRGDGEMPVGGKKRHHSAFASPMAFVTFEKEEDAKKAFDKCGQSLLKIGGEPVDVYYSRLR